MVVTYLELHGVSFFELQEAAELAAQGRRQAVVLALQVSSCLVNFNGKRAPVCAPVSCWQFASLIDTLD